SHRLFGGGGRATGAHLRDRRDRQEPAPVSPRSRRGPPQLCQPRRALGGEREPERARRLGELVSRFTSSSHPEITVTASAAKQSSAWCETLWIASLPFGRLAMTSVFLMW